MEEVMRGYVYRFCDVCQDGTMGDCTHNGRIVVWKCSECETEREVDYKAEEEQGIACQCHKPISQLA